MAVKRSQWPDGDNAYFDDEGNDEARWHWLLQQANSQHIVRLFKEPPAILDPTRPDDDELHVMRLLMEYLPMGTLNDLLERRATMAKPFTEFTLLYLFDCLIDSLIVMEYGQEATYNVKTNTWEATNRDEDWLPICHFDIKPANGLLIIHN